jgi:transcriptional regulator with XRE-family HTH domain
VATLTDQEFRSFLQTLGARIKQLRKEKKLRLRDIMIRTGYYDAQWRKYESGGSLNIVSLMKVALALDVSLSTLLDGLGQWPKMSVEEIQQAHTIQPKGKPPLEKKAIVTKKVLPSPGKTTRATTTSRKRRSNS